MASVETRPAGRPAWGIGVGPAVEAASLSKRYGEVDAVKDVSFSIQRGEVFAFLGPNGAGKTTTVRMLCTLARPSGGQARVAGFDVARQPKSVRRRIGLVFQEQTLDDRLPAEQERGISIDLGYAPLELPDGTQLSVVDVPGHERFVRTMVAGASGIDLFLLVIDAAEGARPQTHEHLAILRLLGIERGVVALTKADLVDEETLEVARAGEKTGGDRGAVAVFRGDAGLADAQAGVSDLQAGAPPQGGGPGRPAAIRPASVNWRLRANTQAHTSPLSNDVQTYELPGARWVATLLFQDFKRNASMRPRRNAVDHADLAESFAPNLPLQ